MALKTLVNGAFQDITTLKICVDGVWQEADHSCKCNNGVWENVWGNFNTTVLPYSQSRIITTETYNSSLGKYVGSNVWQVETPFATAIENGYTKIRVVVQDIDSNVSDGNVWVNVRSGYEEECSIAVGETLTIDIPIVENPTANELAITHLCLYMESKLKVLQANFIQ